MSTIVAASEPFVWRWEYISNLQQLRDEREKKEKEKKKEKERDKESNDS